MSRTTPEPCIEDCPSPQSPVDIRPQDTDTSALPPLRFHHPTRLDLELHYAAPEKHCCDCTRHRDNEGTVKAVPPRGQHGQHGQRGQQCLVTVGDDTYQLVDVHWHTPSEHTVGGVPFPLEQHMKYRSAAKGAKKQGSEYAVIGVFVHPGQANDSLDRLLSSARRAEGSWEVDDVQLDALLPSCTESYRYLGSTTVCPYTPGVRWTVLTHPVQASAAALEHYRELFPEGNALTTQPIGDRRVVSDRHRWW